MTAHSTDPIGPLRDHLESELAARLSDVIFHGKESPRTPNTSSLRIEGCEAAAMMILLDRAGVCVSAGSACHTGSHSISHVLAAMGLSREQASQTLRISLSRFTTKEEVEAAILHLVHAAEKVRSLTQR